LVQSAYSAPTAATSGIIALLTNSPSLSISALMANSRSKVRVDWLSGLIGLATPPTARFWMCGVFEPRMATIRLAMRWYSSACK
jgi:hypothetical protein